MKIRSIIITILLINVINGIAQDSIVIKEKETKRNNKALIEKSKMEKNYSKSLNNTDDDFINWCETKGINIFRILHVVTWEDWDDGIGVYIFTEKKRELAALSENDIELMKSQYLKFLKKHNYPFDKFPNVLFEFDSDQNIQEYYEGNYFFRMK